MEAVGTTSLRPTAAWSELTAGPFSPGRVLWAEQGARQSFHPNLAFPFLLFKGSYNLGAPRTGFCCFLEKDPDLESGAEGLKKKYHVSETL